MPVSPCRLPALKTSAASIAVSLSASVAALLTLAPSFLQAQTSPPPGFFATPELVKDISDRISLEAPNQGTLSHVGDRVLLHAYDPNLGEALWISDATGGTIQLLKVINPVATSLRAATFLPVDHTGLTYFTVFERFTGYGTLEDTSLWVTDGTPDGTRRLTGLLSGSGLGVTPQRLEVWGDKLTFWARTDDDTSDQAFWVSDGTPEGTQAILGNGPTFTATPLLAGDGVIYVFVLPATNYYGRGQLWQTDGTPDGFTYIKDLPANAPGTQAGIYALGVQGKRAYFTITTAAHGWEPWVTDGTDKGTFLLKDIQPGKNSSEPAVVGKCGNRMIFSATTTALSRQLYATDGTVKGTVLLQKIASGNQWSAPEYIGNAGDRLYFSDGLGDSQYRVLGVTDGTPAGTRLFDTSPDPIINPVRLGTAGDELYFTASGARWVVGGAYPEPVRTSLSPPLPPTPQTEFRHGFTWSVSPDATTGGVLTCWKSDGTPEGTVPVLRIPSMKGGSEPRQLKPAGDRFFFTASLHETGRELWISDGTAEGTRMVKDINPGKKGSDPDLVGLYGGLMYFTAVTDPRYDRDLWRSDGTAEGTFQVANVQPLGSDFGQAPKPVEVGGQVYFAANRGREDTELWVSNGTSSTRLKELLPDGLDSYPTRITAFQGRVFFCVRNTEVWVTDGTPAGTQKFASGTGYRPIQHLTVMDAYLYWMDGANLMRSDGTPGGTVKLGILAGADSIGMVARPPSQEDVATPDAWTIFTLSAQNGLYRHSSGSPGVIRISPPGKATGLWRCGSTIIFTTAHPSDPSPPNQQRLWGTDGQPDTASALVPELIDQVLTATEDRIYYTRQNAQRLPVLESIRPDGTGRHVLQDNPKNTGFKVVQVIGNRVYFVMAHRPLNPAEVVEGMLWETEGTPETTRRIPGGQGLYHPDGSLVLLQDQLYLGSIYPGAGAELCRIPAGSHPRLSLTGPAGEEIVLEADGNGVIELPPQLLHQPRTRTLTLRNTGLLPLTGFAFSAPDLADFQITPAFVSSLAPQSSLAVEITFTPQAAGLRQTEVQFSAPGISSRTLRLRGRGLASGDAGEVVQAPVSQLVLVGQPVTFSAGIVTPGGAVSTGWQRTPGTALAATGPVLTLPSVQAEDAGSYSYTAHTATGDLTTATAALGVVQPIPPHPYYCLEGYNLTLRCFAAAPADTRLTYQWYFRGVPVISGMRIVGSQGPTLIIQSFRWQDFGEYECRVTMHAPDRTVTISHGSNPVLQLMPPQNAEPSDTLQFYVGQDVQHQLVTTNPVEKLTVKGLPPGLKLSQDGLFTGRPTKALPVDPDTGLPRTYKIALTLHNTSGTGQPSVMYIRILPIAQPGTYEGLLARHPDLTGGANLGGRVQTVVTSAGGFSGQLTHGGKIYRFASPKAAIDTPASGYPVGFEIPISLGKGQPPLTLQIAGENSDHLQATLTDAAQHQAWGGLGQRNPAPYGEQGSYTVLLKPRPLAPGDPAPAPDSGPQIPAGHGSLILTLAKNGVATWKGRLADGSAITGSGSLIYWDDLVVPLHHPLYQATGSLHGSLSLWRPPYLPPTTPPDITWVKAPEPAASRSQVYKDGIFFHHLTAVGNQSFKPEKGWSFWGLPRTGNNLRLTLTGEGLPEEGLTQTAGIDTAYRITLPRENTALKSLSINTTLRTFKGSFLIRPSAAKAPLSIPFEGVFTNEEAGGFFLIPEVAEDGTASLKTSRLHSGRIQITPIR